MSFRWIQQNTVTDNTGFRSKSLAFNSPPTPGNVLIVSINQNQGTLAGLIVKDNNNNTYTPVPLNAGVTLIFYLLNVANVGQTITASWTSPTSAFFAMTINEFSVSGGIVGYDNNAQSSGTASGTSITLPQVNAAQAGGLLFATCAVNTAITAPTLGGTLSGWTGGGITTNGDACEYILSSASGNTSVAFTTTATSDPYTVLAASFKLISLPSFITPASRYGSKGSIRIFGNVR